VTGKYATFNAGVLELSEEQYQARAHLLEPIKDRPGFYNILKPTGFKRGEVLGFSGEVNKALAKDLSPSSEAEEEKEPGKPIAKMSKDELIHALVELKVDPPDRANKPELKAILLETRGP
jgi:hypothetical protein